MNKHELKSLLENIYTALTEDLTLDQVLDMSTGNVRLGTASDIVPPPPPPKPIFLDPAQLGVPGMYPGSGFPPGHQNNPYDWDRFWERHRVV